MTIRQRICAFTGRPISPSDHASVQLILADLDDDGRMTKNFVIFDVCGKVRREGTIDELLTNKVTLN